MHQSAWRIPRAQGLRYDCAMREVIRHLLILVLALGVCLPAAAESDSATALPADVVQDAGAAARQAVSTTGGRVLDVQKRFFDERAVYVVKVLLTDGRVKIVEIEANPTSAPDFLER
jgi:hypothetical protein